MPGRSLSYIGVGAGKHSTPLTRVYSCDAIGNPTSYYNGTRWAFSWQNGRQLASASNGTESIVNTYDADGLRTGRTDGDTAYAYVYVGTQLVQMTITTRTDKGTTVTKTLNFAYDASGTPATVTYDGATYYYITNLQGDVTAIMNSSGTAVVQYTYDAWARS